MALALKPFSITYAAVAQSTNSSGVFENPSAGPVSASIRCYIAHSTPQTAFEEFGVAVKDPYIMAIELADAEAMLEAAATANPGTQVEDAVVGTEVFWTHPQQGAIQLWVKAPIRFLNAGTICDHADVLLSRLQYEDPNV